jgi:hypothetical protein
MAREHLPLPNPDRLTAARSRVADLYQQRQQRQAQDFVDMDSSRTPRRPLPALSADQLADLRRRVQAISDARDRQRTLDPPIAVPVDEHERARHPGLGASSRSHDEAARAARLGSEAALTR